MMTSEEIMATYEAAQAKLNAARAKCKAEKDDAWVEYELACECAWAHYYTKVDTSQSDRMVVCDKINVANAKFKARCVAAKAELDAAWAEFNAF